jgi:PAS domain S-box-containing protein
MKEAFDGAILDCGEEGCSAYAPIYDETGKATALLGVELYMEEIWDEEENLEVIQDYWVDVVENVASEIDADKLAQLKTPEDEHTAAYRELKSILQSVKDENPEIYEIYIMAELDKENILLYLVDVYEPPEIGEEYDVSEYPQMQLAFDGAIADEEIAIDRWGAWLSAYAPIYDINGTAVAIVGLDMDAGNVVIAEENLRNRLIFIFLAALLLSLIASIFFSRHFTKPVTELVGGTKAISRGDFDHKVEIKTGDELEALGDAFNKMAQRVKNSFTEMAVRKELENTMNTMTETLTVVDPDGNIIKANKAAFDLLGYTEAELIGLPFDKIVGKKEGGKIGLEKRIREAKASVTSFETTYLTKDGKEIPVNFAASIMKDEKGELQGIVCNADDITERKRAEEEREHFIKELETKSAELEKAMEHMADLEEVTRMKTDFLSITSHELRTPLTPMKAQLQMLQEGYVGKMNEKQKKSIEIVLRNLTRLGNLIADILDISRMEAGRIKMVFESMSINDAVKEAIKMQEPFAEEKDIQISAKLAALPNIVGDAERLRQAIGNLLNNAIKFSKKSGKVVIETTRSDLEGKENIQFSITDYGIGISKANQKKLFKPFSQIDTSMGREQDGTGLGLAIVKGIIHAHNGKVWSESELGKGTTFYFVIPTKQKITEKEASYIG